MLVKIMGGGVRVEVAREQGPISIVADAREVEQVLLELCENAREAMPTGGRVAVTVRRARREDVPPQLQHPEDWVILSVSDTGTGVPDDLRDRLFEPFFTTRAGSTGLGLPTVRDIVSRLGGRIDFMSSRGAGSTFTVLLPAHRGSRPRASESADRASTRPEPNPVGRTILLVEADAAARSVAERALAARGHRVLQAEHGVGALEMLEAYRGPLDLLITSLAMSDVDADALASRVLALHPEARVLYVGQDEIGRAEGPTLPSDVPPGVLVETVEGLLGDYSPNGYT
jgi:two-component system cell cycle sensor histidine kinase/response regulator CckA